MTLTETTSPMRPDRPTAATPLAGHRRPPRRLHRRRAARLLAAVTALGVSAATASACVPPVIPPGPVTTTTVPRGSTEPVPAGAITLVALGDSLTEGTGDDRDAGGYVGRLGTAISQRPGRQGSTVVNRGRSGWASQDLIDGQGGDPAQLAQARDDVAAARAAGRPVVATVLIGSNDLWYLYEYGSHDGTTAGEEAADREHYRRALTTIVHDLKTAGATVVLAVNDDQSHRPVAADDSMRRATFPDTSAAEVAQMSAQAHAYETIVADVATAEGALVADFIDAPLFRNAATLAEDGNHPNAAGYDQLTDLWLGAMAPLAL